MVAPTEVASDNSKTSEEFRDLSPGGRMPLATLGGTPAALVVVKLVDRIRLGGGVSESTGLHARRRVQAG